MQNNLSMEDSEQEVGFRMIHRADPRSLAYNVHSRVLSPVRIQCHRIADGRQSSGGAGAVDSNCKVRVHSLGDRDPFTWTRKATLLGEKSCSTDHHDDKVNTKIISSVANN